MKAVVAAFNQEKALVGAFSVIVQPVVEPMGRAEYLYYLAHDTMSMYSLQQQVLLQVYQTCYICSEQFITLRKYRSCMKISVTLRRTRAQKTVRQWAAVSVDM